jgi:hypothetical protein|tara:strand:- start:624 stop:833 length:210 start_codon:yes stop_codon:yes gene_type:complete
LNTLSSREVVPVEQAADQVAAAVVPVVCYLVLVLQFPKLITLLLLAMVVLGLVLILRQMPQEVHLNLAV